jgi:putative membrane protein
MITLSNLRNIGLGLAMAGLCSLGAVAQSNTNNSNSTNAMGTAKHMTASERMFIRKAAEGGKAEVELGKLAQEKAASPEVKQFGERMVNDHSKANDQLKEVAQKEGVTLPTKLDAKDAATKARLEKLSGEAFDRAYMKDMVADHAKDVREFKNEAKNGKDPDVKNFAAQTAPTLEDHLKEAKNIAPKTMAQITH